MRASVVVNLSLLASTVLAAGELFKRQDTCSDLTTNCPVAQDFCYDYLTIGPARTTSRTTLTAVTKHKRSTIYISTSACPTEGPMRKRDIADLEGRATKTKTPACLKPYTSDASSLSSACSCFNYPITSSTRTISVTKIESDAPTTTIYGSKTVTSTTLTTTPTCAVVATDPDTGAEVQWEIFYGICNAFRVGFPRNVYEDTFNKKTLLCEALQSCANGTTYVDGETFEVTWNEFSNRPGGPRYECNGYAAGPEHPQFYAADNWYESYGYKRLEE